MKKSLLLCFFTLMFFLPKAQGEFITTWKPGNIQTSPPQNTPFPSSDKQAWMPIRGNNFNIYWEEVGFPAHNATLTNLNSAYNILLDFGSALNPVPANATYRVKVSNGNGNVHRILFHDVVPGSSVDDLVGDTSKIIDINQWGSIVWSSMAHSFAGCHNLNMTATDSPDLSLVTDMQYMFSACQSLVGNPSINNWDTSQNTNLNAIFHGCTLFNQPLNNWNTSNVTSMGVAFMMAQSFNQPLGNWDTSQVNDNMTSMFFMARNFNQPIGNWDVSSVTDMEFMFSNAWQFNQNINNWNTGEVIQMNQMFLAAKAFNQPIGSWNTSKVYTMQGMFSGATAFNQNIGSWNVSNVSQMNNMFTGATSFNQNLGNWNLTNLVSAYGILQNSGLNCQNYDSTLYGWSNNPATPNNIDISNAAPLNYTHPAAIAARNSLINNKGWTITGDLYNDKCSSFLSTKKDILKNDVSIYPNPAADFIYIKNVKDSFDYTITDVSGRVILQGNLKGEKINLGSLTKGNYILKIKANDITKNVKFIKN